VIRITASDAVFSASLSAGEVDTLCREFQGTKRGIVSHFFLSWVSLLYDSPLNSRKLKPARCFYELKKQLLKFGLTETIRLYSHLADLLMLSSHETGSIAFTRQWVSEFEDTPVFREYHEYFKTDDACLATYLLSFCLFGKKLKLQLEKWNTVAFRDWELTEERLSKLTFSDEDTSILKSIVSALLGPLDLHDKFPAFGPGKVAQREIRDVIDKACHLEMNYYLSLILSKMSYGDDAGGFPKIFIKEIEGKGRFARIKGRGKSAAKDINKSRSIVMEPNQVMFVQQLVLEIFRASIATGLASGFINFEDQSLNRKLAHYGSYSGDIDTIDLSSASDSVSWELVKRIFPKEYLFFLALSRTRDVEVMDGSVRRLWKFAPMGSALCFPTQCIVFLSVCIYSAMRQSGWLDTQRAKALGCEKLSVECVKQFIKTAFHTTPGYSHPGVGKFQPVRVYGDDICVDASLTPELTLLLTRLGFVVNVSKSFTSSSSFRESCGGYYLRGYDVTPVRYSLPERGSYRDAQHIAACIALTNRAGDRNYMNLRRFLMQSLLWNEDGQKQPYLFSSNRDLPYAFYSERPVNDHLETLGPKNVQPLIYEKREGLHNRDWQTTFKRCIIFSYETSHKPDTQEKRDALDSYLMLQWWARQRFDCDTPEISGGSKRVTVGSRLRQGWNPV